LHDELRQWPHVGDVVNDPDTRHGEASGEQMKVGRRGNPSGDDVHPLEDDKKAACKSESRENGDTAKTRDRVEMELPASVRVVYPAALSSEVADRRCEEERRRRRHDEAQNGRPKQPDGLDHQK